MKGVRQHILLEFFEKLFASLALGSGTVLAPLALFPLLGRRVAWRKFTPKPEVAKTLAYREIVMYLAMALGALLSMGARLAPFDPLIQAVFFLILSIGAMMLAERSSAALAPKLTSIEWKGRGLRNLAGWAVLGLMLTTFERGMDTQTLLGQCLVAMAFAAVPVGMAYHRGEPGLLLPGALITVIGIQFWNPWIAAAGFGWLIPSALLITHNLRVSFAFRSLVCWVAAVGGLWAPSWVAIAAAVVIFLMTFESWRFIVRLAIYIPLRTLHRFRVYGAENMWADGPGILLSNHVTLADGWLLGSMTQRMCRFLVYDAYYKSPVARFFLNLFRSIPISQGGKREVIESLRQARRVIEEGHFAGIFPEGGITRSGHLHPFQKGFTRIIAGTQIPVIPAYMNGLWTSMLSFSEAKVHLKIGRWFRDMEIEFGTPLPPTVTAKELWAAVKSLEVRAAYRDAHNAEILPIAFLKSAGRWDQQIAVREKGKSITYGALASSALMLARHINKRIRRKARIGIFLPDGIEKIIAHVAIVLSGHVAMEVPEMSGEELEEYVNLYGLSTLVTSQAWMVSHKSVRTENLLYIGRALEKFSSRDATRTWLYRKLSASLAWKQVCTHAMRKDSAAVIVGSPSGPVVLSHRGIWSAAHAARRVLWWRNGTRIKNGISMDRAVGVSIGVWMPLLNGSTIVYDQRQVDFEILDGTDVEKAHEDSKRIIAVNPEGELGPRCLPLLELAEVSGAVSLSSPPVDFMGEVQTGTKRGTFGQLPFGLELKETEAGIQIRTPARMLRYLNAPESKSSVQTEDWLDVQLPLTLDDQNYVELKPTSELQTSSTPLQDQTTSNLQGE